MKKINQLDLFSGIGGFHLGFERAGFKVKSYFSEIDPHAVAVYKHQFKNSTYVGSVTDVRGEDLPRIDLITFGSPCQDFSIAGNRKGMGGDRSSLILEAIRLIGECRPRVFIWENVKGTFSSNSGEDFASILQAFTNIGGYRLEWQLLNTSWFHRTPQNRERVYLVGYLDAPKRNWRGVFPITGDSGKHSTMESSRKTIAKCLTARGQADLHSGLQLIKEPLRVKSANSRGYDEAYVGDSINLTAINSTTRRGRVGDQKAQTLDTKCEQAVLQPKIIEYTRNAKGEVTDRHLKDVAGTVHSSTGGGGNTDQFVLDKNYTYQAVNKTIEKNEDKFVEGQAIMMDLYNKSLRDISPTLIDPKHSANALFDGYRIRRLHPIETERLQGFPDNHTAYGNYDGEVKEVSKSQRYKQCGNAVTVDVVQAIAEKLKPIFKFK